MLQENKRLRQGFLALAWTAVLAAVPSCAYAPAAAPVMPLTVCEVLRDLPAQTGKTLAVLGRYSWREKGSWVSQDTCDAAGAAPHAPPPEIWMVEDHSAPHLPDDYELDAAAVKRKLAEIQRHTTLAKFRFGTPDYDRWAVIWGRVEPRKEDETPKAAANLEFRGAGVIFFLTQ